MRDLRLSFVNVVFRHDIKLSVEHCPRSGIIERRWLHHYGAGTYVTTPPRVVRASSATSQLSNSDVRFSGSVHLPGFSIESPLSPVMWLAVNYRSPREECAPDI
jgi:hypothetical protein